MDASPLPMLGKPRLELLKLLVSESELAFGCRAERASDRGTLAEETMLTRRHLLASAGAALLAGARSAAAQDYPKGPIHFIAGFPAGGGIDISARLLGEPMRTALAQPVIVENRTGAAGMIAANAVAKAPPDGQLLLMATSGEIAISLHLYKEKMTYDPLRELAPVSLVGIVPCVVVVNPATPVHTPQQLVAYAKAHPGKLSFSSSGVGNPQQLAGELMNIMAGIDVLHVPYRGAAPAVTDVATGAVTMSFTSLAAAQGLLQDGKLRAVAVTSLERMPQLPNVAPLQDGSPGLKGYELLNWFGVFTTGGTSAAIIDRLNGIINTALKQPKIADTLTKQGIVPRPMSAAEFGKFVAAETEKFGKIVKAAHIKLG
jgi:tripartite-type tricarboxylate transporter receptor subunit TctC